MVAMAKLFKNGASQAVRLPKDFRFDSDEVCIKRVGSAVLLFPKKAGWNLMAQAINNLDEDFMADRHQPRHADKRKPLAIRKKRRP